MGFAIIRNKQTNKQKLVGETIPRESLTSRKGVVLLSLFDLSLVA